MDLTGDARENNVLNNYELAASPARRRPSAKKGHNYSERKREALHLGRMLRLKLRTLYLLQSLLLHLALLQLSRLHSLASLKRHCLSADNFSRCIGRLLAQ